MEDKFHNWSCQEENLSSFDVEQQLRNLYNHSGIVQLIDVLMPRFLASYCAYSTPYSISTSISTSSSSTATWTKVEHCWYLILWDKGSWRNQACKGEVVVLGYVANFTLLLSILCSHILLLQMYRNIVNNKNHLCRSSGEIKEPLKKEQSWDVQRYRLCEHKYLHV